MSSPILQAASWLLILCFVVQKLLRLVSSYASIFAFIAYDLGVILCFKENVLDQCPEVASLCFLRAVSEFQVLHSCLWSIFSWFLYKSGWWGSSFFFDICSIFPTPLTDETPLFIMYGLHKNSWLLVYLWVIYSNTLIYCLFIGQYHTVLVSIALQPIIKSDIMMSSQLYSLCLGLFCVFSGYLRFDLEVVFFSISVNNVINIFKGITFTLSF